MYNTPYNQDIQRKMLDIDKAYIQHSRRQRVGTQEILTRDPLIQGGRMTEIASALMGGSAVADPAYVASLAGDGVGSYKASGLSGGYMGSLYRPPVPDMYIHGDDPRFEGLGQSGGANNIGLAQSPESVEYFEKKAQGGRKKKCIGGALVEKEMVMDEERKKGKKPDISLHGGASPEEAVVQMDGGSTMEGKGIMDALIPMFLGLGKASKSELEGRGFLSGILGAIGLGQSKKITGSGFLSGLLGTLGLGKSGTMKARIARLQKKAPRLCKECTKDRLAKIGIPENELKKLEGSGFWDDVWTGFKMPFEAVGQIGKAVAPALPLLAGLGKKGRKSKKIEGGLIENSQMPSRIGGAKCAGTVMGGAPPIGTPLDKPKKGGANATMGGVRATRIEKSSKPACRSGIKDRAEIVRKVMKEKGLSMIEASKYVKQNGLY
jgi:hypothetical protein